MKNFKVRRLLISVIGILVILEQSVQSELPLCEGPTTLVKVTVQQVGISPIYLYTVTNLSQSSLRTLSLGDSDHPEMLIEPASIPKVIESPPGWKGQAIFKEETEYMHIFWKAQDPSSMIAPNISVSGFKVEMSQPSDKMKQIPFRTRIDSKCVWGRVSPE